MDILIVVILCLLGLVLILVEIFLIPGVTVTIILGAGFLAGGVYYAFAHLGMTAGVITLVVSALALTVAFVYLVKSKALDKTIALNADIDSTVASDDSSFVKEGDEGVTLSRLNPIGKVKVNGVTMEGKTLGEFLDEDKPIVVVKVSKMQLLVKIKEN